MVLVAKICWTHQQSHAINLSFSQLQSEHLCSQICYSWKRSQVIFRGLYSEHLRCKGECKGDGECVRVCGSSGTRAQTCDPAYLECWACGWKAAGRTTSAHSSASCVSAGHTSLGTDSHRQSLQFAEDLLILRQA